MLDMRISTRRDGDKEDDAQAGLALVMVLVLMLVGFVIASLVAASVLFTFRANEDNLSNTQAFVAAESGRDAMLAAVMANGCTKSIADSTSPTYRNVTALFGADATHLTDSCLSTTASATIQITSTGYGPEGDSSTIVALYQRLATYTNQPGGSLAYFSGTFKLTKSTYLGDVVIRDGTYTCNSDSTINGDLWVPRGGVILSQSCNVTGSIYARDAITVGGPKITIGTTGVAGTGDVVSQNGSITIDTNNGEIIGNVLSGGSVTLSKGTVDGNVKAKTTITGTGATVKGTKTASVTPSPAVFNPTLEAVYQMTNWLDLGSDPALWGTDVQWTTVPNSAANCKANMTATLGQTLGAGKTRYGIDYRACTTEVTVTLNAGNIKNDAVFLVPAAVEMNVTVGGSLTSVGAAATPQLFIIHADAATTAAGPNCGPSPTNPVDELNLPGKASTFSPYLMIYSPCGLDKVPNSSSSVSFTGQFYAADNETSTNHWVQPEFTCHAMAWSPLINLGCYIKDATGTGDDGTIITTIQPPSRVSQVEQ
ncbi:hypothetical protein [Microbacterium sp. NPDC056057]|uniref:hypothetical protein n=1 Tax=Microbacterium sp. NPDC056057 TaxID=3345699 RepID=UPI0035DB1641